jgi:uncharacterized protein
MYLIKQFFLVLLLCLHMVSYADDIEINQGRILHPKGLLWKIEKPGQEASHIFGTMHVGDPSVVNLAPEVEHAFRNADRFAMEMLLTMAAEGKIISGSFFNDGRTLKSIMQSDDYRKLLDLLNRRLYLPENVVTNMRPWAVLVMLMMPRPGESDKESALDMMLYRRASVRKIPLLGLETPEEQLAVFDTMSLQDQVWMLNRSVQEFNEVSEQMPLMLKAYVNRNLEDLVKLQDKAMSDDSDIDDLFMHELVDKRNIRMVDRMQDFLAQGNAFIAIGALHLPGKNGVLHLLEQQGYSVSSVY